MKKYFSTMTLILIPIAIAVNFIGGQLASILKLPMYLDMIGTILVAALAGPVPAMVAGGVTNLILGLSSPTWIPYAIVQIACGGVAGYAAMKGAFKSFKWTAVTALAIWASALLTAVPITTILFGGIAGGGGGSVITAFFLTTGQGLWQSVTTSALITETVDKFLTTFIVFFLIKSIPLSTLVKFPLGPLYNTED